MKLKLTIFYFVTLIGFLNIQAQENNTSQEEQELLGLPGDNLNLYATLDLFQKSKTIEDFECDQKHFELADGLGISPQYYDG